MDFMQEYEKWLRSPALSPAEHAELEAIRNDPKEIEIFQRFSRLADEDFAREQAAKKKDGQ